MTKDADEPMRARLERARSSNQGIRLVRAIPDAGPLEAYVVATGRKWVLMVDLGSGVRLNGYVAVRIRDIERVQPLRADAFVRQASQAAGVWPPKVPDAPIDLDTTRGLVETAAVYGTLVNVQVERIDPEAAFIGVPGRMTSRRVWLQEVNAQAEWDGTVSTWALSEITRVEFSSSYEHDLLLVAGPPPRSPATDVQEEGDARDSA